MSKPWERVNTPWRDGVREFYDRPQPTKCDLTDEELQEFYRYFMMDDKPWRVAGELRSLRAEVERLQARERELEAALTPLYNAGYDVIRRVAGDPDAPDHVDMLRALTDALQDARPLVAALAAVDAETEDER